MLACGAVVVLTTEVMVGLTAWLMVAKLRMPRSLSASSLFTATSTLMLVDSRVHAIAEAGDARIGTYTACDTGTTRHRGAIANSKEAMMTGTLCVCILSEIGPEISEAVRNDHDDGHGGDGAGSLGLGLVRNPRRCELVHGRSSGS